MSEKRYRVDETDSGGYKIVDQIKGRYVPFDTYKVVEANAIANLLNQQADELREAQAGAAAMREAIVEFARKSYTQVVSTRQVYIPFKDWDAFRDFAVTIKDTTAGVDLLTELEQLQGYRAFVHSCIKSGEVCIYTFEEYLEKMKSE